MALALYALFAGDRIAIARRLLQRRLERPVLALADMEEQLSLFDLKKYESPASAAKFDWELEADDEDSKSYLSCARLSKSRWKQARPIQDRLDNISITDKSPSIDARSEVAAGQKFNTGGDESISLGGGDLGDNHQPDLSNESAMEEIEASEIREAYEFFPGDRIEWRSGGKVSRGKVVEIRRGGSRRCDRLLVEWKSGKARGTTSAIAAGRARLISDATEQPAKDAIASDAGQTTSPVGDAVTPQKENPSEPCNAGKPGVFDDDRVHPHPNLTPDVASDAANEGTICGDLRKHNGKAGASGWLAAQYKYRDEEGKSHTCSSWRAGCTGPYFQYQWREGDRIRSRYVPKKKVGEVARLIEMRSASWKVVDAI